LASIGTNLRRRPTRVARQRATPFGVAVLLAITLSATAWAQQAGENINVLPVFGADPIRGDAYLQRQVEPALGVSTRNAQHLLAFFNDYRAVDVPGDFGVGENVASRTLGAIKALWARITGRPSPRGKPAEAEAAAEAWIGMSRSYDGGLTWSGSFLPGFKLDTSPASVSSPIYGLDAATDPVVASAPCGIIYLGFVAFTRSGPSQMMVARFEDRNDTDGGETFVYQGMTTIEAGNNATNGYFLDKPAIAVDVARPSNGCAHSLYVSYTTFNGLTKDGKFQSQVHLATSHDGGKTFSTDKINGNFNENQGSAIAIHPTTGDVYVFWRHFFTPDTMVYAQLGAATGKLSKPAALTSDALRTFDQPLLKTTSVADPVNGVAFRSNAFPTAAIARDGTVIAAWQERVDPATGLPSAGGTPRIVLTSRGPKSSSWTPRRAIDNGTRVPEAPGLGYFFDTGRADATAHPQVMPSLSCAGGVCLLTYLESRAPGLTAGDNPGWIGGYSRVMDLRAAVLDSSVNVFRSFQVSRYPYKVGHTGEGAGDIDEAAPGTPRLNFVNYPTSGGGTAAFVGDYTALVPVVPFVPNGSGGWRWSTGDGDLPYPGFLAAWSDNRNLVPPATGIAGFPNYAPPNAGGCGPNVGSRNTDVLSSRISLGLLVTAPTTTKTAPTPPDTLIDFPMTIWNNTSQLRQFRLTIDRNQAFSSFSKTAATPVVSGTISVYPFSSVTKVVYTANTATTHVSVTEATPAGSLGLTGGMTFNGAWSNPTPAAAIVPGTLAISDPANPIPQNPIPQNPIPQNPIPQNPIPQNFGITDTTWTVTANGDPTKAYLALVGVDKAYAQDYAFQLLITKPSTFATCADGAAANVSQGTLVANVWDPSNPIPQNPIPQNPIPQNNGFPDDAPTQNSTFVIAPATQAPRVALAQTIGAGSAATSCPDASGNYPLDGCTAAAPRNDDIINVTLRAYQVTQNPSRLWRPDTLPPSITIADYWCDGSTAGATDCGIFSKGSDLVAPAALSVLPTTVGAGQHVTFPATAQTVPNTGTVAAGPRRYGFYLTSNSSLALNADGTADMTKAVLLASQTFADPLAAGSSDTIAPQTLTIPAGLGDGIYYLFLYADDQRIVSELNESNNIGRAGPLTVAHPQYGLAGFLFPCQGDLCVGSAGSSNQLAWQFTIDGAAVDSPDARPELWIYRANCSTWAQGALFSDVKPEDPGASSWQYAPPLRPPFTWQYTWSDPGATAGCYLVFVGSRASGQTVPNGTPLGPVRLLLR